MKPPETTRCIKNVCRSEVVAEIIYKNAACEGVGSAEMLPKMASQVVTFQIDGKGYARRFALNAISSCFSTGVTS
jgi:hypothetical protein